MSHLNPPPTVPGGLPSPFFFVRLVESVRLLFEYARPSYQSGIVAGTTQTQAGATQITGKIANVATVATTSDALRLPPADFNLLVEILNSGANAAAVWPAAGDTIDGGADNAVDASTLGAGNSRRYLAINDDDWITLSG
jgi:hypothetical protein